VVDCRWLSSIVCLILDAAAKLSLRVGDDKIVLWKFMHVLCINVLNCFYDIFVIKKEPVAQCRESQWRSG
jgi:hypothetical protein